MKTSLKCLVSLSLAVLLQKMPGTKSTKHSNGSKTILHHLANSIQTTLRPRLQNLNQLLIRPGNLLTTDLCTMPNMVAL